MQTQTAPIDEQRLQDFLGKAVTDLSAAVTCANILVGAKLGLYGAMAGAGPVSPGTVAQKTGTNERLVHEWLNNQAAAGYVSYDADTGRFELPAEHAAALTDEDSPAFIAGIYDSLAAIWRADGRLARGFRDGTGMGWHEHDPRLFVGTERFFRPGYRTNLTTSWIPALDGVEEKLQRGAIVADVGCDHGASTIIMAQAYPLSRFYGFDYHAGSIETARERAAVAGVSERVTFDVAAAQDIPARDLDLVCFFDCLHDMGDPVGAARPRATRSSPTAPCCSSSPWPTTRSRTT